MDRAQGSLLCALLLEPKPSSPLWPASCQSQTSSPSPRRFPKAPRDASFCSAPWPLGTTAYKWAGDSGGKSRVDNQPHVNELPFSLGSWLLQSWISCCSFTSQNRCFLHFISPFSLLGQEEGQARGDAGGSRDGSNRETC